jgi:hypothetical protein
MTNCLFHQGLAGVTARLVVSFRGPVRVNEPAEVRAHIASERRELCLLKAELRQSGTVKASAEGKFMAWPGQIGCVELQNSTVER